MTKIDIFSGFLGAGKTTLIRVINRITIPDNVTIIGTSAFANCTNLTSVTIPESITEIGVRAFRGCEKLTTIKFIGRVPYIDAGAFAPRRSPCSKSPARCWSATRGRVLRVASTYCSVASRC